MKADLLLQTAVALGTYPAGEAIDTNNITARSDVENFVPSITAEWTDEQEICNIIEEASNGEVFVDTSDLVQFRHQLQTAVAGAGFTIKNKNATNDNADDTMYLRGRSWDYTESMYKSDNYSNHLYGILPAESDPPDQAAPGLGGIQTNNNEIAQKFRPTHSHWLPGDFFFFGFVHNANATTAHNIPPLFRICRDNGAGLPLNTGGIVANLLGANSEWNVPASSNTDDKIFNNLIFLATDGVTSIPSFDLDVTQNYWILGTFASGSTTDYFRWDYRTTGSGTIATAPRYSSTSANGGTGWVTSTGLMWFSLPRRRSQAFVNWDTKAIKAMTDGTTRAGITTTTISSLPSYVKTKEGMYRYLTGQLYYMSRPRVNYNFPAVTAPNIPVLPGDPIMISDSVLGFSAAGSQAVMATCGDMNYSWSNMGGQGQQYQAPTILSINAVSNPTRYR